MTGFYDPNKKAQPSSTGAEPEWTPLTMSRTQIDTVVIEAQKMRSEAIGSWIRHTVEDWASLLRRPGRAIPSSFRNPKVNV